MRGHTVRCCLLRFFVTSVLITSGADTQRHTLERKWIGTRANSRTTYQATIRVRETHQIN